jgi:HAD superfamily hydrolase (TIGR01509 family)
MADVHPGVLFDVDGTLVDTNYLHTLAWSRAFAEVGRWAPMNAIHRLVGMGGDQLVPTLFGEPDPVAEQARARHYEPLMAEVRPFPGATELLRALHDEGLAVVLATSSPKDEFERVVELLGAADAVDAHTTTDDVSSSKPSPDIFRAALAAGRVDPERALVVGDSVWDVRAARAAGLGCLGVETGGFSRHELAEEGALHVYRNVRELLDQRHTSPLARLLGGDQATCTPSSASRARFSGSPPP